MFVKWILLSCGIYNVIWGLQVVLQRPMVTYYNPKYVERPNVTVRRLGRNSPYYLNIIGYVLECCPWYNNVSVSIEFYEFLHNEYRPSFVQVRYPMCDFLTKSRFIGRALAAHGLVCPILPGLIQLKNLTFPADGFPNTFPFEKGRVYVTITVNNGDTIGKGHVDAQFTNLVPKKKH